MDFNNTYRNAFADIRNYRPVRDDAVLDSSVNWPINPTHARNIVNRFYEHKGVGLPSREKFKASNSLLNVDVRCTLKKYQCCAPKANGQRCTRNLAAGLPLCFQHCSSTFGVKISKTSLVDSNDKRINMLGLFACRKDGTSFKEHDVVCPYIGEILTYNQLEQMYPGEASASYALTMGGERRRDVQKIDSACLRGIGSYVNTAPYENTPNEEELNVIKESGSSIKVKRTNGQRGNARSNCEINMLVTNLSRVRVRGRVQTVARNPQPWIVATREIKNGEELFAPILSYNRAGPNDKSVTVGQNLKRTTCTR